MSIYFLMIVALAGSYFLFKNRPLDFFTIAFFSSVIYFFPAFFGLVSVPGFTGVTREIEPLAYLPYILVPLLLLVFAFVHDHIPRHHDHSEHSRMLSPAVMSVLSERQPFMTTAELVLYTAAFIATVGFLFLGWSEIVTPGKPIYGREHAIYATIVPIAFACSVMMRRYGLATLFLVALAVDVIAGNREAIVFAVGAAILIRYLSGRPVRLSESWKALLSGLLLLSALIVYKEINAAFMSGNYDLVSSRLTSPDWYRMILMRFEPFTTQAILTDSVRTDLIYDGPYFYNLIHSVVPMAQNFGFNVEDNIGQFYDHVLYPFADFGVAGNIWAEGYMIGGWPLMTAYIVLYALSPWWINALFHRASLAFRPIIAVSAIAFLFFIHRTGLEYNLTLQVRIWAMGVFLLVFLPCLLPRKYLPISMMERRGAASSDRERPEISPTRSLPDES